MTLFFPDLNIWLALSVAAHSHSADAWDWVKLLSDDRKLIFSRYTQIGLLRLLTNNTVMGEQTLTLRNAWHSTTAGLRTLTWSFILSRVESTPCFARPPNPSRPAKRRNG